MSSRAASRKEDCKRWNASVFNITLINYYITQKLWLLPENVSEQKTQKIGYSFKRNYNALQLTRYRSEHNMKQNHR